MGVEAPSRPLASPLFVPSPIPVLAQADFEECQQHGFAKPDGHQGDGEYLAGQAADQGGGQRTGHDQHGGRPKPQDASAGAHVSKVQPFTAELPPGSGL